MKIIYTQDGRNINFVDVNNVLLGFENRRLCCEKFGYFFSIYDRVNTFSKISEDTNIPKDLEDYNFDADFYEKGHNSLYGNYSTFKIVNSEGDEMFLHIFNKHNGYYAHGFKFCNGDIVIKEGRL